MGWPHLTGPIQGDPHSRMWGQANNWLRSRGMSQSSFLASILFSKEDFVEWLRKRKIRSPNEYRLLAAHGRIDIRCPDYPRTFYKTAWIGLLPGIFTASEFVAYVKRADLVGISSNVYEKMYMEQKLDPRAPGGPDIVYGQEFCPWHGVAGNRRHFRTSDLKKYLKREGITTYLQYLERVQSGTLDRRCPRYPDWRSLGLTRPDPPHAEGGESRRRTLTRDVVERIERDMRTSDLSDYMLARLHGVSYPITRQIRKGKHRIQRHRRAA